MKSILLCLTFLLSIYTSAQITLSGPMQGHTTDSSANLWLMIQEQDFPLEFELIDKPEAKITSKNLCKKKWCTYNIQLENLTIGEQQLKITSDNKTQIFDFEIQPQSNIDSFSFLLGSCALRWGLFKPFIPNNNSFEIFNAMSEKDASLMLWLGDNVYYLFRDLNSESLMFKENALSRQKPSLSKFIQTKQHYAIWDDHDYGPDNSEGHYEKKTVTKNIFDAFWVNPAYDHAGNYFSFTYGNAEFFMLDSRWYKSETEPKTLLGEIQMNWLKTALSASTAKYKFIAFGSQMINPTGADGERFAYYTSDYEELLSLSAKLNNVFFLSGDMHYSTMFKNEDFGKPLYEFSCSPISSFSYKIRPKNDEYNNPYFVPNTQYHEQNFGKITVTNRQLTFEVFDNVGDLVWRYVIDAE